MEPYGTKDKAVPPLVFTKDQSKLFGELNTTVYNAFGRVVRQLRHRQEGRRERLGRLHQEPRTTPVWQKFLGIYQTAYDAKYKKK